MKLPVFARARTRSSASPKRSSDAPRGRRGFARARAHPPIPPRGVRSSDAPGVARARALERSASAKAAMVPSLPKWQERAVGTAAGGNRVCCACPRPRKRPHDANGATVARLAGGMVAQAAWPNVGRPAGTDKEVRACRSKCGHWPTSNRTSRTPESMTRPSTPWRSRSGGLGYRATAMIMTRLSPSRLDVGPVCDHEHA